MAFETFDLGKVLATAEGIKGMRRDGAMDALRQKYLGVQIGNAEQQQVLAANQDQRAAAAEGRAQSQFSQEQQFQNTRTLNVAARAVQADPTSVSRWLPVLKENGIVSVDFDPSNMPPEQVQELAARLAAQTDAVLSAYMKTNPQMVELDARHQATLGEIQARLAGESKLAAQNNQYTRGQIELRGAQELAVENARGPGREVKTAQSLRKEFEGLQSVQNYRAVEPLVKSAQNAPDDGYGDLDMIYAVGKILDPASVVREGELKLVLDAGSPLQKILGKTRFNFEKGGRITPKQREQLLNMINGRAQAVRESYEREASRFGRYAQEAGLEPAAVIGEQAPAQQAPAEFDYVPGQGLVPRAGR